jgi:tripeptide aminopeptidase
MMKLTNNAEERRLKDALIDRFVRYTKIWTTSYPSIEKTPTSCGQWDLACLLQTELAALGIKAELTDHCYVLARIPSNLPPDTPEPHAIGFLAHLDTANDVSGKDVKPCVVDNYDGKKIVLRDGITLDPSIDPDLAAAAGKTIIHTDGLTLLGADDKAGIAAIVCAAGFLLSHSEIKHGPIELIFTPDEETGKGLPEFPLDKVASKVCYTLDGGAGSEFEIECFNAYGVDVSFTGRTIHPGTARGTLVNAALMAVSYAAMLPRTESPEATDGYYGFYCLMNMSGDHEKAALKLILRDFTRAGMERRLAALESFAHAVEAQFPGGKVTIDAKPTYYNMREKIEAFPQSINKLKEAAKNTGIEFILKPIRGGTDGARLAELGIPAPNIFTGGRNFHSRAEWLLVDDMLTACRLIIELAEVWAR